jgi:hypothetical protein
MTKTQNNVLRADDKIGDLITCNHFFITVSNPGVNYVLPNEIIHPQQKTLSRH